MRYLLALRRNKCTDAPSGADAQQAVDAARLEDRVFFSATPIAPALAEEPLLDAAEEPWLDSINELNDWNLNAPETILSDLSSGGLLESLDEVNDLSHELIVIDSAVDDYELLLDDLISSSDPNRRFELLLLDGEQDSIGQISDALSELSDLDALHLISHGSDGRLELGDVTLDADSLSEYADDLSNWSDSFSDDADILIYGCDVAASDIGQDFVEQLGDMLGVDVASSIDVTGAAELGGDWELEYAYGEVESSVAFSVDVQQSWFAVLATPTAEPDTYTVDEEGSLTTTDAEAWFDSSWTSRQKLTFDNTAQSGSLDDFPVLVVLDGTRIDYSKVQDNGEDLRFVDADGTLLDHEIESWDESGTSYVWVRVNQIDGGSNTDFMHMYYDNEDAVDGQDADGVWANGFAGVYHMNSTTFDATANGNNGINTDVIVATGQIGGAGEFNGSTSIMGVADDPSLQDIFAGGGSISAWINPADWGEAGYGRIVDKASSDGGGINGWAFRLKGPEEALAFKYGFDGDTGRWWTTNASIQLDAWQHVAVVYDADDPNNDPRLYIDGVEYSVTATTLTEGTAPSGAATSDAGLDIGIGNYANAGFGTRAFDGTLDEVRLVNTARSADWIAAEYLAGTDMFLSYGTEELGPGGVLTNDTDADGDPLTALIDTLPSHAAFFNLNPDGSFTYQPVADFDGVDSFTYVANDGMTNSVATTVTINVEGMQDAPTASAGSDQTIAEGDSLTLDATASFDPDTGDTLTYSWDLDNDGNFGDATGDNPTLSWTQLQPFINDDGTYTITVRVDDGLDPTTASMTLTVENAAPTITISGDATVHEGVAYVLNLSAIDPGDDTISEWSINWGDGTVSTILGNPSTATHIYDNPNLTYNITASVTQADDGTFLQGGVLVSAEGTDDISRLDTEGNILPPPFATGGELVNHGFMIIGPDGMLYVGGDSDNVVRYDPMTGALDSEFIPAGTIDRVEGLEFGPDGNLYVASANTNEILRFSSTGQFIDVFVRAAYGLINPQGIAFGDDGYLYVADANNDRIMKFDGNTGVPVGEFVAASSGGLDFPVGLTFHDGFLYVSSWNTNEILRYDAADGSFDSVFVSDAGEGLDKPVGLSFGPDGKLYVASLMSDAVLRYTSAGTFDGEFASFTSGAQPNSITFLPGHQVTVVDVDDPYDALWLGITNDDANPQLPGITGAVAESELLQFTDPNMQIGTGSTDGTFSIVTSLAAFANDGTVDLEGIHYVTQDIVVGGIGNVQLLEGDILFAHDGTETFVGSDLNSVSSSDNDVIVFRPDAPGDYSSGVFIGLVENFSGGGITSFTLVEQDTVIAGERISAGDFLFARKGGGGESLIRWYHTINAGFGASSGSTAILFDGDDIGFGSSEIQAMHFVSDDIEIGGVLHLNQGQLLLSLKDNATLNGTVDVQGHDIFMLTISATESSGTSVGSAARIFNGSDVQMNGGDEKIDMLSIGNSVNGVPTATNLTQAQNYAEGAASVPLDDIQVTDNDAGAIITATLTLSDPTTGSLSTGSGNGETYSSVSGEWEITGTVAEVNAALADIAFIPTTNNDIDATINVHIEDQSGLGPSDGTITLDVTPENDAPTATNLSQTKNYVEDATSVALDDIVLTDVDSNQTFTATLTLNDNGAGSISTGSGNGETYSSVTGVWTVTGTKAEVEAALAAAAFLPAADYDQNTTITTHIEDQDGAGPADGTISLNVTAQNDPPSATNLNQTRSYNEGESNVPLDDIVITDVDSGQTFTASLTLSDPSVGAITAGSGSGESYDSGTGVWSITGTQADVEAALAAASFVPNLQNDQNATITTHIEDQNGAGPADGTIQLNVTPSNDTPTATNLTQTHAYNEGITSVALDDIVITDPDVNPTQTFTLTLTLSDPTKGSLTATSGNGESYDSGTGVWSIVGSKAAVEAAASAVAFQTTADNDVDLSISVSLRDQDDAGPPLGTISLDVTPANDPATATELNQTLAYNEGDASVALNDIVVSDVDSDPTLQFTATLTLANTNAGSISAGSGNGESYSAATGVWTITGTRTEVNAALAAAAFIPATNNDVDTTIATHIEDDQGAGPADGTISLNVTPENDPPSATNLTQSKAYIEGAASVSLDDILITDVDTATAQTFTARLTLANPAAGTLSALSGNGATYSSVSGIWTVTGTKAEVEAALAAVVFLPDPVNDLATTITTHIEDQAGTGPADGTITLGVTPINSAPTATNLSQSHNYIEGDASVGLDDIVVTDVDQAVAQTFTVRLTLNTPAAGALTIGSGSGETYNGVSGIWEVTGTKAQVDAALAAVAFVPQTDNDINTTITTHVEDQDGVGPADGTINLNVTAQNDAPTATNYSQTHAYIEGASLVALDDIVITDIDTSPTQTFTATLTLLDASTGALTALSGNGETYTSATGIWTITGTQAQVEAALAAVGYAPTTDNDVSTSITTHIEDQDGAGPAVDGSIALNVTGTNDAPTATNLNQSVGYTEGDTNVPINDIVVSEVDTASAQVITATLTLDLPTAGTLTVGSGNGETYTAATGIWKVVGTVAEVNAALADVEFIPAVNNDADVNIQVEIVDQNNAGPPLGNVALNVSPQNDAPTATNLNQNLSYVEDTGAVDLDDIVVADFDSGDIITVKVTLADPTLGTLSTASGNSETYSGSIGLWTVTGTVSEVNAALADLSFIPVADNDIDTTLTVDVVDAAGAGPSAGVVHLDVTPQSDDVRNLGSTNWSVTGFEDFINRIELKDYILEDPDSDTATITLQLKTEAGGRLFGFGALGVSVSGSGSTQIELTGTPDDLNNFLQNRRIRYLGLQDVAGSNVDTINVVGFETTDLGVNGNVVQIGEIAISLTNVNDDPISMPDSFSVDTGDTLIGSLLDNDTDVDGDTLSAVLIDGPANGRLNFNSDGTFSYISNGGFVGADEFRYTAKDSSGGTGEVMTVSIDVELAPPPPTTGGGGTTGGGDGGSTDGGGDGTNEPVDESPVIDAPPDNVGRSTADRSQSNQADRSFIESTDTIEPLQIVQVAFAETRASDVISFEARTNGEAGGIGASQFNERASGDGVETDSERGDMDIMGAGASLWGALDTLTEELEGSEEVQFFVASSAAATSAFTVGYVVWLLRAGQLLTSVLAQMPAWHLVDPLPVLSGLDGLSEDDEEDDSLQSMIEKGSSVPG